MVNRSFFAVTTFLLPLLLSSSLSRAAPTLPQFQTLTPAQVLEYKPYTFYAGAAYCTKEATYAWNCGENCAANAEFKPVASGGDGSKIPYWYVGIDSQRKTVIVAHQGTDTTEIESVAIDVKFKLAPLDSTLFPGLPGGIRVHRGFSASHAQTARAIRVAVNKALTESKLNKVTNVGHSLGGALALLDGIFLPLNFPNVQFRTIVYGMPRVGNDDFANYVIGKVNLNRINNRDDPVPIIPGRRFGYVHAHGEIHIQDDGTWLVCPGKDNTDPRCATGDVQGVWNSLAHHHFGPYDGVRIEC